MSTYAFEAYLERTDKVCSYDSSLQKVNKFLEIRQQRFRKYEHDMRSLVVMGIRISSELYYSQPLDRLITRLFGDAGTTTITTAVAAAARSRRRSSSICFPRKNSRTKNWVIDYYFGAHLFLGSLRQLNGLSDPLLSRSLYIYLPNLI